MAKTFNGPDIIYELGNEPNLTQFWNPTNAAAYGAAMAGGVVAIKTVQPTATVISAGIADYGDSTLWGGFIQQMIAAAGSSFSRIDGVGMHTYLGGDLSGARQPPEWWYLYPTLYPDLKKYSAPAKNFYLTEGGFPIERSGNNATRQAILNSRAMLTAILMQVKCYIHYDLINDNTGNASEDSYGLYLHDASTKKPSAVAFGNLMQVINSCTSYSIQAPTTYSGDASYAIRFATSTTPQSIAWTSLASSTVNLGKPQAVAVIKASDLFGGPVSVSYDGSGNLIIPVSDAVGPVLVSGA